MEITTKNEARKAIKEECGEIVNKAMRAMGELIAIQCRVHKDEPQRIFIAARNIVSAYYEQTMRGDDDPE